MNFIVREVTEEDVNSVFDLAQQFSLLNLPPDKKAIARKIEISRASFAGELPKEEANYMFVTEDLENQIIAGSSQIKAKHGTMENPNYSFQLIKKERFSRDLGIGFIHQVLRLKLDTDGATEIGGLVVSKNYRRRPEKVGRMTSLNRFLYIGMYLERFENEVIAEMAPPLTDEGRSEFWESLGRRFTGMPYQEADALSRQNKEFIRSLFPEEDIYLCLLDSQARLVIGRVGPETMPALHMLESLGFKYKDEVDPFDGGPHIGVATQEITLIKSAQWFTLKIQDEAEFAKQALIAVEKNGQFKSCTSAYSLDGEEIVLPQITCKALALEGGEKIYCSEEDKMETIEFKGDYIDGEFVKAAKPEGQWEVYSPADKKDRVTEMAFAYPHIEASCLAARKAYCEWAHTPQSKRFELLNKLKEVYSANAEKLGQVISRETGKPQWEGLNEAKAMAGKIAITLEHSMKLVADSRVENALPGVDGVIRYKPRGVMAVIGPFNFPGHLPNGHIIPALATGNTVVFKPSDKTPATGQLMAEFFHEAGFPKGVFNLIQGQGETGKRLVTSEYVDGVLFTGSYDVGLKIKQDTLNHHWKLLALEMGGKNSTVVWKDADLEKAVYETILGAFLTSGQRCSCTSKVILHKDIYDKFVENFYQTAKKLSIGHWSENPFMGPLISEDSVEKYIRFQEIAKREGAECMMRGKSLDYNYDGNYVTPSIYLVPNADNQSVYQNCEIFGPNVGVYKVDDFDEALEINNSAGFGLVMALFSKDKQLFDKALIDARVGLLNWNRTTNGASSRLPFGGMGKSGNDRPSAHFAVNYTTVPVASLEDMTAFDSSKVLPGIDYQYKD